MGRRIIGGGDFCLETRLRRISRAVSLETGVPGGESPKVEPAGKSQGGDFFWGGKLLLGYGTVEHTAASWTLPTVASEITDKRLLLS